MTSKVTQCPECKTSFRVSEAQLAIADGAVRCGSCLHIFKAPQHWLEQEIAIDDEPELDSLLEQHASELDQIFSDEDDDPLFSDTQQQKVINNIFEEDGQGSIENNALLIDDDEQTQLEENLLSELDEDSDDILFSDTVQQKAISLIEKDDDETLLDELDDYDDKAQATAEEDNELLFEDETEPDETSIKDTRTGLVIDTGMISANDLNLEDGTTGSQELSDSFLDIDSWEEEDGVFKDLDNLGDSTPVDNDDWAKKLLDDEDTDPPENTEQQQEQEQEQEQDKELNDFLEDIPEEPGEPMLDPELLNILEDEPAPIQEDEFVLGDEPMLAGERIGDNSALLANIEPEPVEMPALVQRRNWPQRLWLTAAALAVLGLAGQHLIFNFDTLARNPAYRPVLASLCEIAGCQIPGLDDIKQIRTSNLMVRSSSERRNTLVVDVLITNRAKFQQAFPIMELVFTDLSGKVVAGRHFKPEEYLAGELTGNTQMPSQQQVHISVEIIDPGKKAVNYQLKLFPNRDS